MFSGHSVLLSIFFQNRNKINHHTGEKRVTFVVLRKQKLLKRKSVNIGGIFYVRAFDVNNIKCTHEKWVAPVSVHSIKKLLSVFLSNLSSGCTLKISTERHFGRQWPTTPTLNDVKSTDYKPFITKNHFTKQPVGLRTSVCICAQPVLYVYVCECICVCVIKIHKFHVQIFFRRS